MAGKLFHIKSCVKQCNIIYIPKCFEMGTRRHRDATTFKENI